MFSSCSAPSLRVRTVYMCLLVVVAAAAGASAQLFSGGQRPPLLENIGHAVWKIETRSPLAQQYFNQGLRLLYGFNFEQAIDAFRAANTHDGGGCAICFWGEGYAVAVLRQAELRLLERPSPKASALVAALRTRYAAAAEEYPVRKHELDLNYAAAMRNVSRMFPADHHIASFFADALMNTMPWDYYVEGRAALGHTLRPAAAEAREVLERLLQAEPMHEGGKLLADPLHKRFHLFETHWFERGRMIRQNTWQIVSVQPGIHLYIHLLEAGDEARLAQPYAEKLAQLAPAASHLVHMPSHTFMHTGHFEDAVTVNAAATYVAPRPGGPGNDNVYPLHNREFLVWALRIEGRSAEALEEARRLTALAQPCAVDHVNCKIPGCHKVDADDPSGGRRFERFSAAWPLTVALFGDQAELTEIEELPPPPNLQYHSAMWHFAIGSVHARLASAATRRRFTSLPDVNMYRERAEQERQQLSAACNQITNEPGDVEESYSHPVISLCTISVAILSDLVTQATLDATAEQLGPASRNSAEALAAERLSLQGLRDAVGLEDLLEYDEPPTQFFPSRHFLGAALLRYGKAGQTGALEGSNYVQEAVRVYEQALQDYPNNGWALHGLTAAFEAGGVASIRKIAAAPNTLPDARRAVLTAWERADVELVDSATIELPATRVRIAVPGADADWEAAAGRWVDREQRGGAGADEMSALAGLWWAAFMCSAIAYWYHRSRVKKEQMHGRDSESWRSAARQIVEQGWAQQLGVLTAPLFTWVGMNRVRRDGLGRDEYGELDSLIDRRSRDMAGVP